MIVFSCVGFVFLFGINWSLSVVGFFCSSQLPISLYLTSATFSWWGRPSGNCLITLIHLSSCEVEMGSSQDLFCLPIGSFSTEPGLWRVRCLLLECHPFKCQSRWGTTGTAPYALVELKQGPNFPNLCRIYLPQKLSTLNLNIPTKQDKEKENQSQFSSQFSEGCYLRQLLKTTWGWETKRHILCWICQCCLIHDRRCWHLVSGTNITSLSKFNFWGVQVWLRQLVN